MPSSYRRDRPPDPAEALAHDLLIRHGSDPDAATRPEHGWANEVWLGAAAVVRIKRAVHGAFAREIELAALLPREVGYPTVLDHGVDDGMEWMVTVRLPGTNLESTWPALDEPTRALAVGDLWTRLEAVHRTDIGAARGLGCTTSPFYALDETAARELLDWLQSHAAIDRTLHRELAAMIARMFRAIPAVPLALGHTDAGPHNAVWDGVRAIPVDFETAAVAPVDLDLEHLFRTVARLDGEAAAPALADRARALLDLPGAAYRLWGYAVLRDLWGLRGWVRHARAGGDLAAWGADPADLGTWEPHRNLAAHAAGESWLSPLL